MLIPIFYAVCSFPVPNFTEFVWHPAFAEQGGMFPGISKKKRKNTPWHGMIQ